jgi:hypothetical protein
MQKNEWVKYIQGEPGLINKDGLIEYVPNISGAVDEIVMVRFFDLTDPILCLSKNLLLLKTAEEVDKLGGEFLERRFNNLLRTLNISTINFIHGKISTYNRDRITEAMGKWEQLPDDSKGGLEVKSWKFHNPNAMLYVSSWYDAYDGPDYTYATWLSHRNPRERNY